MRPYICRSLKNEEVDNFLGEHHKQESSIPASKNLGIFIGEELLGFLQTGLPRTSAMKKEYSLEIYRLTFKPGMKIPGGISALIKDYVKLYNPSDLFTYQDITGENIEDLGWQHVAKSADDSIWEWINPNLTYYTYKITASDSEKYYYGVSHIKKPNATVEDCLNNGYYGSGGEKFSNWRARHLNKLQKQIISLHTRKAHAYAKEEVLVSDSYKTDDKCLNSAAGGQLRPHVSKAFRSEICSIHGASIHNGDSCLKCVSAKAHTLESCSTHGTVIFFGGKCKKCIALRSRELKDCSIHGVTKHQGDQCYKCMKKGGLSICKIHGLTNHFGEYCMNCRNESLISLKYCKIHGEVKHIGDNCYPCISSGAVDLRICPTHGETKHRGDKCFKCRKLGTVVSEKLCPVHGMSKHQGDTCAKCSRGAIVMKMCSIHGETKHRGDACFKCAAAKRKPRTKS